MLVFCFYICPFFCRKVCQTWIIRPKILSINVFCNIINYCSDIFFCRILCDFFNIFSGDFKCCRINIDLPGINIRPEKSISICVFYNKSSCVDPVRINSDAVQNFRNHGAIYEKTRIPCITAICAYCPSFSIKFKYNF